MTDPLADTDLATQPSAAASAASPATDPVPAGARWWRDRRRLPWWRIPLYPAAFGSALVLLTWSEAGLPPALLVRPLLLTVGATLGLTFLLAAIFRDRDRAALVASAVALLIITWDDRVAVMLTVVIVVVAVEGLAHRGRPAIVAGLATRLMAAVGFVMVLAVVIQLAQSGSLVQSVEDLTRPALPPIGAADPDHPDIFVFVLDAYPGDRAATRASAYDPDAFPAALTDRGFDVARDSHANYLQTPLTFASMLAMRHLADIPSLGPPFDSNRNDLLRLRVVMDEAAAFVELRAAGYAITVVDAGYAHAQLRRVDRFIEPSGPSELEHVLLRITRLERVIETIAPATIANGARSKIEDEFATVERLASERSPVPRLVLVHVAAPHPPWVFEADGRSRNPRVVTLVDEPDLTVQQGLDAGFALATHVAALTTHAVDAIVREADRPAVIVVMSDHGPDGGFSATDPLSFEVETRASNFMAARTPGHPGLIGDRLTPVNLFPTLLDAYLGTRHERAADSIWSYRRPHIIDTVEVPPIDGWTDRS
jgi:hypothetical protein